MSVEQKLYWSKGFDAGVEAERERILDMVRTKRSQLFVEGYRDGESRYILGWLVTELGGNVEQR